MKHLVRIILAVVFIIAVFIGTNLVLYYDISKKGEDVVFIVDTLLVFASLIYMVYHLALFVRYLMQRPRE